MCLTQVQVQTELTQGTGSNFRHLESLPAFLTFVDLGPTHCCLFNPFPVWLAEGAGCRQNPVVMLSFSKLLYLPNCYRMLFPTGPPARPVSAANAISPTECTDKCLRQQPVLLSFFSWTDYSDTHQGFSQGISFGNVLGLLYAGNCL